MNYHDLTTHGAILVLERGANLPDSLAYFAELKEARSGWVTGIGAASSVTVGFYDLPTQSYIWRTHDEPLEILSLNGNLTIVDGAPFWHLHGVFSTKDGAVIGGHVKDLTVHITAELHIDFSNRKISRSLNPEIGLKLIEDSSESQ